MKLLRKTAVKQVITETSKTDIADTFKKKKDQAINSIDQLAFEKRKLIKQHDFDPKLVESKFVKQEDKFKTQVSWYETQMEQLELLPIGSEIKIDEVEELIEISIGDDWSLMDQAREIVVEDGKIIRISG
ncbi:YlqD family protein [Halalkalibacillus halophilus]|uniref:YlqD family protein n=1 Tax=Halalkalibacillus halophilus TaxID=392827 RepID=UPI0003FAD058|nr:YlqD family protein [Halalkalibacillus halophilus]